MPAEEVNPAAPGRTYQPNARGTTVVLTEDAVYAETVTHIADAPRKGFSTKAMHDRLKVVTVEFDGQTGDVWYRPWAVTPRVLREMIAAQNDESRDSAARIMDQVTLYVDRWDVLDEDGQPLPVTVDAMEQYLPTDFLAAVINAIRVDMQPTPTTGDASSAG